MIQDLMAKDIKETTSNIQSISFYNVDFLFDKIEWIFTYINDHINITTDDNCRYLR